MKRATLWTVLVAVCAFAIAGCGSGGPLTVTMTTAPTTIAAGGQANLIATVTHDPRNAGVTWSCAPAGLCGTFNPVNTASGAATMYTAPVAVPAGGSIIIAATSVTNTSRSASATITINTANFSFYVSGEEGAHGDIYSIAGVIAISTDGSGTVVAGEQDYNDGDGITSPQPTGDSITGGTLVMAADGSGNATLTLVTNNPAVGVAGTETFALAFANTDHAAIVQFDGTATSSGSYDLETTATAPASSSFAFTSTGQDPAFFPTAEGGQFDVDASGNITGTFDVNDAGAVVIGTAIPAGVAFGPTDLFGRGTVAGSIDGTTTVNFYMVGPEVVRLIDIDATDSAVGSAYGQGSAAGTFTSGSIGQSVFSMGNPIVGFGTAGQFTTEATGGAVPPVACTGNVTCDLNGVADLNDLANAINGFGTPSATYTVAVNGYGSADFGATFGSIEFVGIYAVDPTLNILDPNNLNGDTASEGGALIADLDTDLVGIGTIVPQTDTAVADFAGTYAFGAQGGEGDEFDLLGTGTMTPGPTVSAFTGEGTLNDLFGALTTVADTGTQSATFTGNLTADAVNVGRSTMDGADALVISDTSTPPDFTINVNTTFYQAGPGQVVWVDMDAAETFTGALEQIAPLPAGGAKKALAKKSVKKH